MKYTVGEMKKENLEKSGKQKESKQVLGIDVLLCPSNTSALP